MARVRTGVTRYYRGHAYYYRTSSGYLMLNHDVTLQGNKYSSDEVHPYPYVAESGLTLWKDNHHAARVNYVNSAYYTHVWDNVPVVPDSKYVPIISVQWDMLETDALLRIQENEPLVDAPLALFELKDIPRMIRQVQKLGSKFLISPEAYLAAKWEFAPAIGDLQTLFGLQAQIAERMRQHRKKFRRRRASGGLPFRVSLANVHSTAPCFIGLGRNWDVSLGSPEHRGRCWYTARIEPQMSFSDLLAQQASLKYQLNFSPEYSKMVSIWNGIPWSWLIDYFTNLGDLVALRFNKWPYKVTSLCLMATCHVSQTVGPLITQHPHWPPASSMSPGKLKRTYKRREVRMNPVGGLAFSAILTNSQISNLLALGAVMSKRF